MGSYSILEIALESLSLSHENRLLRESLALAWKTDDFHVCCEFKSKMDVSKNRGGPPKSSIFIGFSIIFTIHFGGFPPIFGSTPKWGYDKTWDIFLTSPMSHETCQMDTRLSVVGRLIFQCRPRECRPRRSWRVGMLKKGVCSAFALRPFSSSSF